MNEYLNDRNCGENEVTGQQRAQIGSSWEQRGNQPAPQYLRRQKLNREIQHQNERKRAHNNTYNSNTLVQQIDLIDRERQAIPYDEINLGTPLSNQSHELKQRYEEGLGRVRIDPEEFMRHLPEEQSAVKQATRS